MIHAFECDGDISLRCICWGKIIYGFYGDLCAVNAVTHTYYNTHSTNLTAFDVKRRHCHPPTDCVYWNLKLIIKPIDEVNRIYLALIARANSMLSANT